MFKLLIYFLLPWIGLNANEYSNPIAYHAPDPWMQYYKGNYYLIATTWTNKLGIRKASTLEGLRDVDNEIVYTINGSTLWAPEIHLIEDRWYAFYAAVPPHGNRHHNYVLQSASDDPMGPYTLMADLNEPDEDAVEELDPSYIIINGKQYFMGSFHDGPAKLFIKPMTNPYTPAGPKHFLSAPTYDWEKHGNTNEGPEPLYHDGRVFIVFSASTCSSRYYSLGLLEFVGTDPLNSTHWHKYPKPFFQTSDENHVYAPGHNGFFKSPDGTEDWIVYHANANEKVTCDMERSSRAQKFTWGDDGLPVFGVPQAVGIKYEGPSGE